MWVSQVGFGGFKDVLNERLILTLKRGKHETGLRLRDNVIEEVNSLTSTAEVHTGSWWFGAVYTCEGELVNSIFS